MGEEARKEAERKLLAAKKAEQERKQQEEMLRKAKEAELLRKAAQEAEDRKKFGHATFELEEKEKQHDVEPQEQCFNVKVRDGEKYQKRCIGICIDTGKIRYGPSQKKLNSNNRINDYNQIQRTQFTVEKETCEICKKDIGTSTGVFSFGGCDVCKMVAKGYDTRIILTDPKDSSGKDWGESFEFWYESKKYLHGDMDIVEQLINKSKNKSGGAKAYDRMLFFNKATMEQLKGKSWTAEREKLNARIAQLNKDMDQATDDEVISALQDNTDAVKEKIETLPHTLHDVVGTKKQDCLVVS